MSTKPAVCLNCKQLMNNSDSHYQSPTLKRDGGFMCPTRRVGPIDGAFKPADSDAVHAYDMLYRDKKGWYFRTEDEDLVGPYMNSQTALVALSDYIVEMGL